MRTGGVAAVTAAVAAAVTLVASPAAAATGDVLSYDEWNYGTTSPATSATVYVDAATTVTGSTVTVADAASSPSRTVTISPPIDSGGLPVAWSAGHYAAGSTATTSQARLYTNSTPSCGRFGTFTSSIDVTSVSYDGSGNIATMSATYNSTCDYSASTAAQLGGFIRIGNTDSYAASRLVPPTQQLATTYGDSVPFDLTVFVKGNAQVTLGTPAAAANSGFTVTGTDCPSTATTAPFNCTLHLSYSPVQPPSAQIETHSAYVFVPITGDGLTRLAAQVQADAVRLPGTPVVRGFSDASGSGVSWDATWPESSSYKVFRRPVGGADWTPLATGVAPSQAANVFVDTVPAPGDTYEYSVAGVVDGLQGPMSDPLAITRATDIPTPAPDSSISINSEDASGLNRVWTTTDGASTASSFAGSTDAVQVGTNGDLADINFGAIPGPGTYRIGSAPPAVPVWYSTASGVCYAGSGSLVVRHVLFDDTMKPVVLDASATFECDGLPSTRVDVHYAADGSQAALTTSPVALSPISSHIGTTTPDQTITVTNTSTGDVSFGAIPDVTGSAASDWAVTGGTCLGAAVAAGNTCAVTVAFTPSTGHARNAFVELPVVVADQPEAPVAVSLQGVGGTVPTAAWCCANPTGLVDRIGVLWGPPQNDGGYPILTYDIERSVDGTSNWQPVATVPGSTTEYIDPFSGYDITRYYRVRADNEIGAGPWTVTYPQTTQAGALVSVGAPNASTPRSLYMRQSQGDTGVPLVTDGHDIQTPSASWSGTRLAYARGETSGTSPATYDIWKLDVAPASAPVQVTSLPGSETDPSWSPDEKSIAFTYHATADAAPSIWVVSANGASPHQVIAGAVHPTWLPDGAHLVVASPTGGPLRTVEVATGAAAGVSGTTGGHEPVASHKGDVIYVDSTGNVVEINGTTVIGGFSPSGLAARHPTYPSWGPPDLAFVSTQDDFLGPRVWTLGGQSGGYLFDPPSGVEMQPTWVEPDIRAPLPTIKKPTGTVRGSATIAGSATDDTTPSKFIRWRCIIDSKPSFPCSSTWTASRLSTGDHSVQMRAYDVAGNSALSQSVLVHSDVTPPKVPTVSGPRLTFGPQANWRYASTDSGVGVRSYDVRYRSATWHTGFSRYHRPSAWQHRATTSVSRWISPGTEICVSVRARDRLGNTSKWSRDRCVTAPLDDTVLARSSAWWTTRSATLLHGSASSAARVGATLSLAAVTTHRIALVVTTCPSCGPVAVSVGGVRVGSVPTFSASTTYRRIRWLTLSSVRSGRLVIRSLGSALVQVDAVAIART